MGRLEKIIFGGFLRHTSLLGLWHVCLYKTQLQQRQHGDGRSGQKLSLNKQKTAKKQGHLLELKLSNVEIPEEGEEKLCCETWSSVCNVTSAF